MIRLQERLHTHLPPHPALCVKELESLLVEKGLVDARTVDRLIELFRDAVGPRTGARVVARAWSAPAFRERLLSDARRALEDMGLPRLEATDLEVVENTPTRHNLVVCSLCSCYPWGLQGLPPTWYKSFTYRSRAVRDPRGVLREFGGGWARGWSCACGTAPARCGTWCFPSARPAAISSMPKPSPRL